MKTINYNNIDLKLYQEILSNKLEIYYLPMYNNDTYNIELGVKFGGKYKSFYKDNELIKIPEGTAHYLEHKMFESSDNSDVFEKFTKHGSYCNAYTTESRTCYVASGNNRFEEDLTNLIDYVTDPFFTDENIEKEQGIINEEIKRGNDNIYRRIIDERSLNVFTSKEYQQTVIGTKESISKINKELLYDIYNNFYVPNNMYLVITGNFDINKAKEIVKNKLSKLKENKKIKIPIIKEKNNINIKNKTIEFNTNIDKVDITIKLNSNDFNIPKYDLEAYINVFLNTMFGDTSDFYQKLLDNNLISEFFSFTTNIDDYILISIIASTNKKEKFIKEVNNILKNIKIIEEDFNRMKKVYLANLIQISDKAPSMKSMISEDITRYNRVINDRYNIIKGMNYNQLNEIIKKIDFNNKSITIVEKK